MPDDISLISLQNLPMAYCLQKVIYDGNGKPSNLEFIDANKRFELFAGKKRREVIGKMATEVFPDIDNHAAIQLNVYADIARKQKHLITQQYYPPLDKWVSINAFSPGKGLVASLFQDITSQKNVLKKLVNISEDFLQSNGRQIDYQKITDLMEEISGARFVITNVYEEDEKHVITQAVSGSSEVLVKASAILGFEIIGKKWPRDLQKDQKISHNSITFFPGIAELSEGEIPYFFIQTIEKLFNLQQVVVAKIAQGDHLIGDFTFLMEKGSSFKNLQEVENLARQVGIFIIHNRAENTLRINEKKFREIFESIQDVYFETNRANTLLEVSPSVELLSKGQYNREGLLGKNIGDYCHDHNELSRMLGILELNGEINDFEIDMVNRDGTLINGALSAKIVLKEDGSFEKIAGVMRDISERKTNELLYHKVALAQQATQFKQNFLANMSHEMRTPMNGIIGMTKVLARGSLSFDQRNYLKVIEESSKSLLNLINDVLHLSKIEAGKVELKKDKIETAQLILKIKLLFGQAAKRKGLKLICESPREFPWFFISDEGRLIQVINNLISNAIKFTSKGYIKVTFRQIENVFDNLTLQISVTDSGDGILPEHQQTIFEEFSQVDNSTTRMETGTGLGLAISKRISEVLGGSLQVRSQINMGSTFCFTFKAQAAFGGFIQLNEPPTLPQAPDKLNLSVLVVEDKLVNRLVAELMLKDMGCQYDMAENGLLAIQKILNKNYDAVLMDIQMPVMDGITAVKELRKLNIKLPAIIGLSAEAMEGDAERYISQGMDDYLTKPLDQVLLHQKLKERTSLNL